MTQANGQPNGQINDDVEDLKDRVHARLLKLREIDRAGTGCFIYTGPWQKSGAGVIRIGGKQYTAARAAAWVYIGGFDLDDERFKIVRRGSLCNTPACINPKHLMVRKVPQPAPFLWDLPPA